MGEEIYVDLQILAETDEEDYLVAVSKADLNTLVSFGNNLVIRHWDGERPVVLEPYGETAVRTREDSSESNNLVQLPRLSQRELSKLTSS